MISRGKLPFSSFLFEYSSIHHFYIFSCKYLFFVLVYIQIIEGGIFMLRDKIKAILTLNSLSLNDYAEKLNIKAASLSRKLKDDSFTIQDLFTLAEITGTSLCLVSEEIKIVLSD